MEMAYDWIIGICNSNYNGVNIFRFYGTKKEVKEKLVRLIVKDKEDDEENWEFGSLFKDEICDVSNGLGHEFYGFGCYYDYHIDYTAKALSYVDRI